MALWVTLAAGAGCRAPASDGRPPLHSRRPITEVLAAHTPGLMALPGVVGTAEGVRRGSPVILVLVERRTPALAARLPTVIEGWPVRIEVTGPLRAMPDSTP